MRAPRIRDTEIRRTVRGPWYRRALNRASRQISRRPLPSPDRGLGGRVSFPTRREGESRPNGRHRDGRREFPLDFARSDAAPALSHRARPEDDERTSTMKRTVWLLALFLALLPLAAARGQGPVTALESLAILLWPDYDRPSVLVLLTGTLGTDAPLPAVVTVPLPLDAQLNAVARIDAQNRMIDDIPYSADAGKLTLTTPEPRFHVEYYLPYRIEAGEHIFRFTWLADLSVERLETTVQRPASAPSLVTEPMAGTIMEGNDGLTYYRLPAKAVPSGQAFSLQVRYPMADARLSVERQRSSKTVTAAQREKG